MRAARGRHLERLRALFGWRGYFLEVTFWRVVDFEFAAELGWILRLCKL
jgi:hypothetical protein